jgi:NO-binding membrane sensor protein with MHYT domain
MAIDAFALVLGLIPLESDPAVVSAPYAHDRTLVAASLLIAASTAYAFMALASRARAHTGATSLVWNLAAGAMFGAAIWLTHLMGMLALDSPLVHGLDPALTSLSGVVGVVSGCLAFAIADARPTWLRLIFAGLSVAIGGVVMHYLGMRGLNIEAELSYRATLIVATSVGAGISSIIALAFVYRIDTVLARVVFAMPMAAVIAGLHYTDMAAMIIDPRPAFQPPAPGIAEPWQALGLGLLTACLVIGALCAVAIDKLTAERNALERNRYVVEIPGPASEGETVIVVDPGRRDR